MEDHGKISEDSFRSQMYRYMCELDKARVLYYPHKFKDTANAKMPFTNIVLNPKYFKCYEEMEDYIFLFIDRSLCVYKILIFPELILLLILIV